MKLRKLEKFTLAISVVGLCLCVAGVMFDNIPLAIAGFTVVYIAS